MPLQITPQQILEHRQTRKDSGLVGCITGKPVPSLDFFGYKDVQIWRTDSQGRMPGMDGFDPRDPGCFCFDCRGAWDPKGIQDAELVNEGHERACDFYLPLIHTLNSILPETPSNPNIPTSLPPRDDSFPRIPEEKQEENLIKILNHFHGYLHTQLIRTMDRRMAAKACGLPQGTIDDLNDEEGRLQDLDDLARKMLELLRG